jgi:hypothetical protein
MNRQDAKKEIEKNQKKKEGKGGIHKRREPKERLDKLAHTAIDTALEGHQHWGPGYLEGVYPAALEAVRFSSVCTAGGAAHSHVELADQGHQHGRHGEAERPGDHQEGDERIR